MLDLKVALKNLYTLPLIFGKIPPLFYKNSEINIKSYKSFVNATLSAKNAIFGHTKHVDNYIQNDSHIFFFLNGICTDKNVWEINAKEIETIFDFKVSSLYNPTHGVFHDILECIFGREFDIEDEDTKELYTILRKALDEKEKVVVIAHSQGGIIISQLVQQLIDDSNPNLNKLEIYTFASASADMPTGDYHAEHFANKYDYVSRIGVLEYRNYFHGKVYESSGAGHLLNIHYLEPFSKGMFCVGRSRLSTYLKYKHKYYISRND